MPGMLGAGLCEIHGVLILLKEPCTVVVATPVAHWYDQARPVTAVIKMLVEFCKLSAGMWVGCMCWKMAFVSPHASCGVRCHMGSGVGG
jgi:hypothetical protein